MKTHYLQKHPCPSNHLSDMVCDLCDETLPSNADKMLHLTSTHMKKKPIVRLSNFHQYKCKKCNFAATHPATLADHTSTQHEASPSQTLVFECDLCPFSAPLLRNLRRHTAVTHAKIACDKCKFTTASEFHLTLHKEHNHINPEKTQSPQINSLLRCDLCGLTFVHPDDLDAHIQRRHVSQPDSASTQDT